MPEFPFSAKSRSLVLSECKETPLDVIIVGGGITGAGCLRDGALRGLRIALFEAKDFAFGTSSHSSKLIHGGLRYLENYDFRLVFEANRERRCLLATAPQIVRPLPFIFPVYRGDRHGLWKVAAGAYLYSLLAIFRNIGWPKVSLAPKTMKLEPTLRPKDLIGSVSYFDAVTQDAQLTLSTIHSAWHQGGLSCNYARVTEFLEERGKMTGVKVRDELTGKTYEIHSRWVVNCTGPWSDQFRQSLGNAAVPKLRLTKGIHLVLSPQQIKLNHAVLMLSPKDGRVTFAIPWEGFTLIGTTDTDFVGDPATVKPEMKDVEYLLETVNYYFPGTKIQHKDVISTFAGLRPLIKDGQHSPSQVSREHQIFSDHDGLVNIIGGKLTSYRKMAQELLDWLIVRTPEWQDRLKPCSTEIMPIDPLNSQQGSPIIPGIQVSWKDIEHAIDKEMVVTIEDVLARRTSVMFLDKNHGLPLAPKIGKMLMDRLGVSEETVSLQLEEYAQAVHTIRSGL